MYHTRVNVDNLNKIEIETMIRLLIKCDTKNIKWLILEKCIEWQVFLKEEAK